MSKNQKILYIITKSNWGGAQRYVFDLATSLNTNAAPSEARVETGLNSSFPTFSVAPPSVILSAPEGSHSSEATLPFSVSVALGGNGLLAQKLKSANIPVINIKNLDRDISLAKDFLVFRELLAIFRRERPDIVHLNSSKIGLLGALAARISGIKKIIFTAHGWAFNEDRAWPMKLFLYFMSWLTGLLATDIIVLSDKELAQTKKLPLVFKKTQRVYNGIKTFEILPRNEARKRLNVILSASEESQKITDKTVVIGTIAELHPNKGLDYAIKSFLPLVEGEDKGEGKPIFLIIGSGEDESRLRALIKTLGLEQTVFLAGFLDNAREYLPAFDIFTLTSLKEGLPYVILEAGLAGLPVIATNVGALPEIFEDCHCEESSTRQSYNNQNAILIAPKDTSAITSALQTLLTDPAKRADLAASARARVNKNFTYERMLAETIKIYGSSVIARSDS